MAIYRGFSTVSSNSQKKFVLTDNDLIKQDLLNAFKVKRGARLMQPNFGCIVWEKVFENISPSDVDDIVANFKSIISNDPRVGLVSIDVSPSVNNLTVTLVLMYVSTNQLEQMVIIFTEDSVSF
jgi:phage baseplate assembly protein W